MSPQILRKRRTLAMRRLALAAIGVSYFVWSGTPFGADIGIANPSAVAAALAGATPQRTRQSLQRSMRRRVQQRL
jgi:hypothetical protein